MSVINIIIFTGRGSFGRIYLASDEVGKEVTKANARYVVKIEPHTNGPLFVEVHCLIRTAEVEKGMPVMIAIVMMAIIFLYSYYYSIK